MTNKVEDVKITEFTVYSDLAIRKGRTRLEEVGLEDSKVYKKIPSSCNECKSKTIVAMNVLGSGTDVLFWMCDNCEKLYLTIDEVETEILLELSSQYWTNSSDWGHTEGDLD